MPGAIVEVAHVREYDFENVEGTSGNEQACGVTDRISVEDFCSGTLCVWAHALSVAATNDTIKVLLEADPFTEDSPATLFTESETIAEVTLRKDDVSSAPLYKTNSFVGNFGPRLRVKVIGARGSGSSTGSALSANISVSLCMKTGSTVGPDFGSQTITSKAALALGEATATDGDIRFASAAQIKGRNTANTADADIFRWGSTTDAAEFGDSTVVAKVTYSTKAAGSHQMNVGGTTIFQVSNKLETFVNTLQWRNSLDPEIKQDDINSASKGHSLTLQSQRNNGAGENGNVIVKYGATTRLTVNENAIQIDNTTAPSSNPSSSGYLYVENGQLKYRGSSGTITELAPA